MKRWLWVGTTFNFVMLLPALFFAFAGLAAGGLTGGRAVVLLGAGLVLAVPVLCFACPIWSWKLFDRKHAAGALALQAAPVVYLGFIVAADYFWRP